MSDRIIYLLHFCRPYRHARHFLGLTEDLARRLEGHRAGRGVEVIQAQGIGLVLARTWYGSRTQERLIEGRKGPPGLCPICRSRLQGSHVEALIRGATGLDRGSVEREETEKERV